MSDAPWQRDGPRALDTRCCALTEGARFSPCLHKELRRCSAALWGGRAAGGGLRGRGSCPSSPRSRCERGGLRAFGRTAPGRSRGCAAAGAAPGTPGASPSSARRPRPRSTPTRPRCGAARPASACDAPSKGGTEGEKMADRRPGGRRGQRPAAGGRPTGTERPQDEPGSGPGPPSPRVGRVTVATAPPSRHASRGGPARGRCYGGGGAGRAGGGARVVPRPGPRGECGRSGPAAALRLCPSPAVLRRSALCLMAASWRAARWPGRGAPPRGCPGASWPCRPS